MAPFWISIKTAFLATILTFFLGIYAARLVSRMKRGKGLMDALLTLPMVLPPTVTGFVLLVIFGKNSVIGRVMEQLGTPLVFTLRGAVIAAVVVALPLMYRTTRGAFEQINPNILDAARTLGISERKIFYQILIPNCIPGIISGAILSFARALGEFGATIMIAGNLPGQTQTLSVAVYQAVQLGDRELAWRLVAVMLGISFAAMVVMNLIQSYNWKGSRT